MKRAGILILLASIAGGAGVFAQAQKTTRDKVYSKAQADRGAILYEKTCAGCHDPKKLDPKKEKGPELVGERFASEWHDKPLSSVLETTFLTMPNDGSAVLTEEQAADVIAYILQANGYPEGPAALKYETGKDILIVK